MKRIVLWLLGTIAAVALMAGYRTSSPPSSTAATTAVPDESFDGSLVQTKYGPIQVRIVKAGGKLTDVVVIVYPSGVPVTDSITAEALPKLRKSALAAQSAKIDTVSGATYTSDGYRESLQAALTAAA